MPYGESHDDDRIQSVLPEVCGADAAKEDEKSARQALGQGSEQAELVEEMTAFRSIQDRIGRQPVGIGDNFDDGDENRERDLGSGPLHVERIFSVFPRVELVVVFRCRKGMRECLPFTQGATPANLGSLLLVGSSIGFERLERTVGHG